MEQAVEGTTRGLGQAIDRVPITTALVDTHKQVEELTSILEHASEKLGIMSPAKIGSPDNLGGIAGEIVKLRDRIDNATTLAKVINDAL